MGRTFRRLDRKNKQKLKQNRQNRHKRSIPQDKPKDNSEGKQKEDRDFYDDGLYY